MSNLDKKIENYIFGNIPTSELLDKAYDIKVQNFGKTITYSPKVFIPLTTLCQDSCAYCTFVKTPKEGGTYLTFCLLYTSPSPRDLSTSRMPSSA